MERTLGKTKRIGVGKAAAGGQAVAGRHGKEAGEVGSPTFECRLKKKNNWGVRQTEQPRVSAHVK